MTGKLWRKRGLPVALMLLALSLPGGCGQEMRGKLREPEEISEEREESEKQGSEEKGRIREAPEEADGGREAPGEADGAGETPGKDGGNREEPENESEDRDHAREQEDRHDGEQTDGADAGKGNAFSEKEEWIERQMTALSLEEKIAQMFVISPEALLPGYTQVTAAGEATEKALREYPVGGLVYRAVNLKNADQTKEMLEHTKQYALSQHGIPIFLAVDEEGGRVARIGNNSGFSVEEVPAMAKIGATGDPQKAYEAGNTIGAYLSGLGFNVDFAPDADVLSNPANTVVGDRSFGSDQKLVAEMAMRAADGLSANGVVACVKHFPGHGCTAGDTHEGLAYTDKTLSALWDCELLPFRRAIEQKIPMIMVSHISAPAITGGDVPASLSRKMVTELLREQMGYQGIVVTDDMGMGAIVKNYGRGEAAVMAIEAGCDLVLLSSDFRTVFGAVVDAVKSGRVSEQQIEISVRRILNAKYSMIAI